MARGLRVSGLWVCEFRSNSGSLVPGVGIVHQEIRVDRGYVYF